MNKYYQLLDKVLLTGKQQENKKGRIHYLLNQQLSLTPADLLDILKVIPSPERNSVKNWSCSLPGSA